MGVRINICSSSHTASDLAILLNEKFDPETSMRLIDREVFLGTILENYSDFVYWSEVKRHFVSNLDAGSTWVETDVAGTTDEGLAVVKIYTRIKSAALRDKVLQFLAETLRSEEI